METIGESGKEKSKEIIMPGQPDFIKDSMIKKYIRDTEKLRSSSKVVATINKQLNAIIQKVITEAAAIAREAGQKTILEDDIVRALEKHVGRETLTWQQTLAQVLRQPAVNLRDIANGIDEELRRLKL